MSYKKIMLSLKRKTKICPSHLKKLKLTQAQGCLLLMGMRGREYAGKHTNAARGKSIWADLKDLW